MIITWITSVLKRLNGSAYSHDLDVLIFGLYGLKILIINGGLTRVYDIIMTCKTSNNLAYKIRLCWTYDDLYVRLIRAYLDLINFGLYM